MAAGLRDALSMRWRAGAKKLIFVVGDAPPAPRDDARPYDVLAREAGTSGIIVNAIRCGGDPTTAVAFQQIASLGGGEFSTIAQDGGVRQVATPYDAQHGRAVDEHRSHRGDRRRRLGPRGVRGQDGGGRRGPAAAKADRASYYMKKAKGGADVRAAGDLVGAYATGTLDLGKVAPGRAAPGYARQEHRGDQGGARGRRATERTAAQKEMAELTRKRDEYLAGQKDAGGGFDTAVKATVEKQIGNRRVLCPRRAIQRAGG